MVRPTYLPTYNYSSLEAFLGTAMLSEAEATLNNIDIKNSYAALSPPVSVQILGNQSSAYGTAYTNSISRGRDAARTAIADIFLSETASVPAPDGTAQTYRQYYTRYYESLPSSQRR